MPYKDKDKARDKAREYARKYRAENMDKVLANQCKWNAMNAERRRSYGRKHRSANLEKERERHRKKRRDMTMDQRKEFNKRRRERVSRVNYEKKYKIQNKDKLKITRIKWCGDNRYRLRAQCRESYYRNKKKRRMAHLKYRAGVDRLSAFTDALKAIDALTNKGGA